MPYATGKRAHKADGAANQVDASPKHAARAQLELKQLGAPKLDRFHGRLETKARIADGTAEIEVRHVLMDDRTGERLKTKALTRLRAYVNNQGLAGTGMSWHRCG